MSVRRERIQIPTYPVGPDEKNPMFFEKRNVQGAAGNIFPMAMNSSLTDEKVMKEYTALVLETEYVSATVLPELGGKIYRALDLHNQYDFIYYNRVIKPALIGLCGPWTSGGIEFNWPQHHRPTTFMPVEYKISENPDGSSTVWVGETEPLNRTRGVAGITTFPGRSLVKAEIRLYNRTDLPQSFMWWANLAVAVNEHYRAVFPPDIHWASDHAWAATSTFPLISGDYKGFDMGDGRDVRDYPNVPLSASFFTYNSKYDFLSGYDFGKDAGVVHVADRRVSPGKKMFTWGVGEAGIAWGGKLTDEDGPYIELMTGVFTCNQPDFSWIAPGEFKRAEQYWYPIHGIGEVKNATVDAAMSMDFAGDEVKIGLNVTGEFEGCRLVVERDGGTVLDKVFGLLTPADAPHVSTALPSCAKPWEVCATLYGPDGKALVSYQPEEPCEVVVPEPYVPSPAPEKLDTNERLYLHALHLYQYRHAYLEPTDYLKEALRRDPGDARCNTLMGRILIHRLNPEAAISYLEAACARLTDRNPNPYDAEAFYLLGVALRMVGDEGRAYDKLGIASWDYKYRTAAYAQMAEMASKRKDFALALDCTDQALAAGRDNRNARLIRAALLRKTGDLQGAVYEVEALINADPVDYLACFERSVQLGEPFAGIEAVVGKPDCAIDIACQYERMGMYEEAASVLRQQLKAGGDHAPTLYHLYAVLSSMGDAEGAEMAWRRASAISPVGVLHSRPESLNPFKLAAKMHPSDSAAPYYLGNMFYGAGQFDLAIKWYEESVARGADFPTVFRNLSYLLFNKRGEVERAGQLIKKAFSMVETDAYVFYDLCQYLRNAGAPAAERIALYEKHFTLAADPGRDDNYNAMCETYSEAGRYDEALRLITARNFHSYEGGEGVSMRIHTTALLLSGILAMEAGDVAGALKLFNRAHIAPENFHEGRRPKIYAETAHIDYWRGRALKAIGRHTEAEDAFRAAQTGGLASVEMRCFAAAALRELGKAGEADAMLQKALGDAREKAENAGQYAYFNAMASYLPYEGDKARKDMEAARYPLALALIGIGRQAEAISVLNEATELSPVDYRSAFLLKHTDIFPRA